MAAVGDGVAGLESALKSGSGPMPVWDAGDALFATNCTSSTKR